MGLNRFLNRNKAKEEKKAAEKAEKAAATKTREIPADQVPEIAEANELVIKRRKLLLKQQELLMNQMDLLGVALEEQTNAVCMAAGIDPTGKLVNWGPEGNYIILTKAPAEEAPNSPIKPNATVQDLEVKAEASEATPAEAAPAQVESTKAELETNDDLVVNLEELGQAIKNN